MDGGRLASCLHLKPCKNITKRSDICSKKRCSLAVKKIAALFKMASVKKSCEIKGGGQEMAVMVC